MKKRAESKDIFYSDIFRITKANKMSIYEETAIVFILEENGFYVHS